MTTNRLQSELQRLYFGGESGRASPDATAMQLAVSGPDAWTALARVWQGVQADLGLPAPGIAVAGKDGHQLWFALARPVAPAEAEAFLAVLCRRYLQDVPAHRIATALVLPAVQPATRWPPAEIAPGRWSAFVAPDLAGLFSEEPWLDLPPTEEAQAELLSRLQAITPAEWQAARDRLRAGGAPPPGGTEEATSPVQGRALAIAPPAPGVQQDPRRFLLGVMNDPAVDLRLRIEAAKALLPHVER